MKAFSERAFGALSSLAFVVGTVVGTGIYLKPGVVAELLATPGQIFTLWGLGGLFATAGALVYSHLARNWPYNGGPYYYLKEVYGSWAASLLLAADIFLARPAAVGALASGLGLVWDLSFTSGLLLALVTIGALTLLQLLGARAQGRGQLLLAALQMVPLLAVLLVAWGVGGGESGAVTPPTSPRWAAAFLAVLWAYDGWYNITILGGEVRRPERTFRLTLVGGMVGVTALYLALNAALLDQLGQEGMRGQAVPFLSLFGHWNLPWLGLALKFSLSAALLATLNGTLSCGARMIVAGADDGLVHGPVGSVPTAAPPTLAFSFWCSGLLLLFGGLPLGARLFDSLSEFTAVVVTLLSALTVTCAFRSEHFPQAVSLPARAAAVFYLLVAAVLLYLLVRESNLLALGGVITVLLMGTGLWIRRRPGRA